MANVFDDLIPKKEVDSVFDDLVPAKEEPRSKLGELGRQIGLTGRAIVGGGAQAIAPLTEPVRYLLDKAGVPGQEYTTEQNLDAAMTKAGVPEPETDLERNVQGVGRFVTSLAGGVGETALANKVAGVKPKLPDAPTPTTEQLADRANDAYRAAEDSGVMYRPESVHVLTKKIASRMKAEGMHPKVHSEAANALKAISDVGDGPVGLKEIENLRKIAKDVGSSNKASERRLSKIMSSMIDDFIGNARASDVAAGNPGEAARQITKGRELWNRKSKAETIERLFEVADINQSGYSQSGLENAIRTKFRQLARNEKQMRQFTQEEKEAIKLVAKGGPMDNAMRMLGKLAPRGIISGGLMPAALTSTIGPEATMAVMGAGEVGKRAATRATMKNADNAVELIRRGRVVPNPSGAHTIPPWLIPSVIGLDDGAY